MKTATIRKHRNSHRGQPPVYSIHDSDGPWLDRMGRRRWWSSREAAQEAMEAERASCDDCHNPIRRDRLAVMEDGDRAVCPHCSARYDSEGFTRRPAAWFPIAALYVDAAGPYPHLVADGEWYEADQAGAFRGPMPVVAHPSTEDALRQALGVVRRNGGVLAAPTDLFRVGGGSPDGRWDEFGGYAIRIPRWDFALYIVGTAELPPLWEPRPPCMAWWLCQVAVRCVRVH